MKTVINDEMRSKLANVCEENRELTAANEDLNDRIKKMDKKNRALREELEAALNRERERVNREFEKKILVYHVSLGKENNYDCL